MATIIRVKRKVTDDPVDCLIIECKKKKLIPESVTVPQEANKENSDSIKQIFKYAGIVYNEVNFKTNLPSLKFGTFLIMIIILRPKYLGK